MSNALLNPVDSLMGLIGIEIAKMHLADIIHGDLTTSNMMLRRPNTFKSTMPEIKTELVRRIPHTAGTDYCLSII